jgi:hypothetical protein
LRIFAELAAHSLDLAQDNPGVMSESRSSRRRLGSPAAAFEQGISDGLFHTAQPGARGWQGKIGLPSAMGDATRFDDKQKQPKIDKIEAHIADRSIAPALVIA